MADKPLNVYRFEQKYYINLGEYVYLRDLLSGIMDRDSYCSEGEYYIRSLYFDTPDNRDYYDKLIGVSDRKKIRLRTYDPKSQRCKLEIKNRRGQYMNKRSAILDSQTADEISSGKFEKLLCCGNVELEKYAGVMLSCLYEPKIIIDYEREAFTYPFNDIRITFDKNLRASRDLRLFSSDVSTTSLINSHVTILEVKYNHFLPKQIADVLSSARLIKSSISKYCIAREALS